MRRTQWVVAALVGLVVVGAVLLASLPRGGHAPLGGPSERQPRRAEHGWDADTAASELSLRLRVGDRQPAPAAPERNCDDPGHVLLADARGEDAASGERFRAEIESIGVRLAPKKEGLTADFRRGDLIVQVLPYRMYEDLTDGPMPEGSELPLPVLDGSAAAAMRVPMVLVIYNCAAM